MTETPTTNSTTTIDPLAERQQGNVPVADSSKGITTKGPRPADPFKRAAEKQPDPSSYAGQDLFSKFLINILMLLAGVLDPDDKNNNSLIGMISKALGMNDDDNHSGFRDLQGDIKTKGRAAARDERDYSRFDKGVAMAAAKMGEPVLGKNIYNSQMLELIGKGESGSDYNRVYGKAKRIDLTNMTVNEVMAWQKQYTDNGSESSAAGKYQIIRKTMAATVREMGLTGNEKFDPAMQDRMAMHLLNKRGYDAVIEGKMKESTFADRVAKEWASLKGTNGRGAYDGDGLNAGKISAEQTIAATRIDRTTGERKVMEQFSKAGSAQPPQIDKPVVVADNTPAPSTTPDGMTGYKPRNMPAPAV